MILLVWGSVCASMWRPTVDVGNHPYHLFIEEGLSNPELASRIAVESFVSAL